MKILFCGSSGFLGRIIVNAIGQEHEITPFNVESGGDMTRADLVRDAVRGKDIILHFGAVAVGRRNIQKNPSAEKAELAGTKNFAQAAALENIPLAYASSIRVYGSSLE